MPRCVEYECPDCNGRFTYRFFKTDDKPPERCELCGSYMGDDPEHLPVLSVNISTAKNKVGDDLYRKMEDSSKARIEAVAEMTGSSASELSAMKVTDMKDNGREGDTHAPSVHKAVTNLTLNGQIAPPAMQGAQARQAIPFTTAGPNALTTRRVLGSMPHAGIASSMTHQGQMGKA